LSEALGYFMSERLPTAKTVETCRRYVTGYASAVRKLLWDRDGSSAGWEEKGHHRPQYYWTPSVMIGGKQHGVIGPNKLIGQHTRREAIEQAEGFLQQCRDILAKIDD
jgi:hypothetical protein